MRFFQITFLTMLVFVLNSCFLSKDDKNIGSLTVKWEIAGLTCDEAKVATVDIQLIKDQKEVEKVNEACTSTAAAFSEIEVGNYKIVLTGKNSEDVPVYYAELEDVEVKKDAESVTSVAKLEKIGSGLNITWDFDNGGLCSSNGVSQVNVVVIDYDGKLYYDQTFPCDPFDLPEFQPNELNPKPGLKVYKIYSEQVKVTAYALNSDGKRKLMGNKKITLDPGKMVDVNIKLSDCGGSCY